MATLPRTAGALAAVRDLITALADLVDAQRDTSSALIEIAREQRITNLIVRSQIAGDPAEKKRLLTEVELRMDSPRRSYPLEAE